MRKYGIWIPVIALIGCIIIGGVALRALLQDWHQQSDRHIILLIATLLLMIHGGYRAIVHLKPETEDLEDGTASVMATIGEFFNPLHMRLRTSLSIFILVLAYLFTTPFIFWALLVLLIVLKGALLYQLIRYHKALQQLAELTALEEYDDEDDDNESGYDEEAISRYKELYLSAKRDAIQISFKDNNTGALATGCSKYGGMPDVPEGFEWPLDDAGRPLALLVQIDCADLAPLDNEALLPHSGQLYFFYELGEMNWQNETNNIRVIYNDVPATQLHRTAFPEDLDQKFRLKEWPLRFLKYTSIPDVEELNKLIDEPIDEDEEETYEAYDRLCSEHLTGTASIGHMLGFADYFQDPVVDDPTEHVLLLQLDSNGEYWREDDKMPHDLLFGDDGNIFFYIKRDDLQARRFDQITFALQCY